MFLKIINKYVFFLGIYKNIEKNKQKNSMVLWEVKHIEP